MDGREGMTLSGSAPYYLNRGGGHGPGSASVSAAGGGFGIPPGYGPLSNPSLSVQPSVGGGTSAGSTFQVDNPSQYFSHSTTIPFPASISPGDSVKKKRGRPRKYAPEGANMSLALSPLSSTPGDGSITPIGPKKNRGRPPGSGWKQRLAPLGEWMNKTAGLAFTPHVIHVGIGEDIAAMILSFAQQKPRALCILSANGSVSTVTMRQPTTSSGTVTYEGGFEILCLSGSYLVAETGGPRNRTGGLSISVCSPDGHVIGGAIGGRLIASSPVQVVVCSFIYGGSKANSKTETDDISLVAKTDDKSLTQVSGSPSQDTPPASASCPWPPAPQPDQRHPQMDINLTRG